MNMWLKIRSVKRTRENKVSVSVSVAPGLVCDKLNLCDQIQNGVGKSCVRKTKYNSEYIEFEFACICD
jgi:hypothetical protein